MTFESLVECRATIIGEKLHSKLNLHCSPVQCTVCPALWLPQDPGGHHPRYSPLCIVSCPQCSEEK